MTTKGASINNGRLSSSSHLLGGISDRRDGGRNRDNNRDYSNNIHNNNGHNNGRNNSSSNNNNNNNNNNNDDDNSNGSERNNNRNGKPATSQSSHPFHHRRESTSADDAVAAPPPRRTTTTTTATPTTTPVGTTTTVGPTTGGGRVRSLRSSFEIDGATTTTTTTKRGEHRGQVVALRRVGVVGGDDANDAADESGGTTTSGVGSYIRRINSRITAAPISSSYSSSSSVASSSWASVVSSSSSSGIHERRKLAPMAMQQRRRQPSSEQQHRQQQLHQQERQRQQQQQQRTRFAASTKNGIASPRSGIIGPTGHRHQQQLRKYQPSKRFVPNRDSPTWKRLMDVVSSPSNNNNTRKENDDYGEKNEGDDDDDDDDRHNSAEREDGAGGGGRSSSELFTYEPNRRLRTLATTAEEEDVVPSSSPSSSDPSYAFSDNNDEVGNNGNVAIDGGGGGVVGRGGRGGGGGGGGGGKGGGGNTTLGMNLERLERLLGGGGGEGRTDGMGEDGNGGEDGTMVEEDDEGKEIIPPSPSSGSDVADGNGDVVAIVGGIGGGDAEEEVDGRVGAAVEHAYDGISASVEGGAERRGSSRQGKDLVVEMKEHGHDDAKDVGRGPVQETYDDDYPTKKKKKNLLASYVERQNNGTTSLSGTRPPTCAAKTTMTTNNDAGAANAVVAASGTFDYSSSSESPLGDTIKSGGGRGWSSDDGGVAASGHLLDRGAGGIGDAGGAQDRSLGDLGSLIARVSEMLRDVDGDLRGDVTWDDDDDDDDDDDEGDVGMPNYNPSRDEGDAQTPNYNLSTTMSSTAAITDLVASTLAECRLLLEMSPPSATRGFDFGATDTGGSGRRRRGEHRDRRQRQWHQREGATEEVIRLTNDGGDNGDSKGDEDGRDQATVGEGGCAPHPSSSPSFTSMYASSIANLLTRDGEVNDTTRENNKDEYSTEEDRLHPRGIEDESSKNDDEEEHHWQQGEIESLLTSSSGNSGKVGADTSAGTHAEGREREEAATKLLSAATIANGINIGVQEGEELFAAASPHENQEPITPLSRAEHSLIQRKEKLLRSLEKVNRLLNKTDRQYPYEHRDHTSMNQTKSIEREPAIGSGNDECNISMKVYKPSRCKTDLRVDTGNSFAGPQKKTAASHAYVVVAANDEDCEEFLTTDRRSAHKQMTSRRPTGECDPVIESIDGTERDYHEGAASVPALIEFGTHNFIRSSTSQDSSLMDKNDDTLFLLPDNRPRQLLAEELSTGSNFLTRINTKSKDHRLNSISKVGPRTHTERQQQSLWQSHFGSQEQQQTCPQFLPSLKYSTMQADDDVVGLVINKDNEIPRGLMWETKKGRSRQSRANSGVVQKKTVPSSAKGVKETKRMNIGGIDGNMTIKRDPKFFKKLLTSRQMKLHNQENSGNAYNMIEPAVPHYPGEEQGGNKLFAPPYDFSLHSCSMSPPSLNDDQYWSTPTKGKGGEGGGGEQQHRHGDGSLVTHKPRRLHRKVLNSLRGGIKKSRNSSG